MCADHGNGVARFPLRADGEGDDGAGVAGEVVLVAGLERGGPWIPLLVNNISLLACLLSDHSIRPINLP